MNLSIMIVNLTYVDNITSKFNRSTIPTATDYLKVGDIFESKVKLLQEITQWSIKRGVSFTPVKTIKSCCTIVCASIIDGNICRDVCQWRLYAFIPKSSGGYFKIRSYLGEHTCSESSLRSNHRKATASFASNVNMLMVRKKRDIIAGYIIKYIKAKYHINITYNNAWNTKAKIFGD